MLKNLVICFALTFLLLGAVSALSIDSVTVDNVAPGQEGQIRVDVENDGNSDIEDLSFSLDFSQEGIIPVGSSEAFLSTLDEDDDETFGFRFQVANDLAVGTYSIPYKITYEEDGDDITQSGTIGIVVSAEPDLDIIIDSPNPIVGAQTELNVRVVNKGLADARFVYLYLESEDLTMLSQSSEYIGTIESDDFETANFDVIYNNRFSSLNLKIVYKDFENQEKEITRTASVRAYTNNEAVEKGILKRSNAGIYVGIVILLLVLWIVIRTIRKRRKNKE
jgi:hypothetical protein